MNVPRPTDIAAHMSQNVRLRRIPKGAADYSMIKRCKTFTREVQSVGQ